MTFRTFMNSIGNAFKTGWNNGNIQKGMKITGATAFGVGAIGAMAHEMKKNNCGSIFGGCCYGGGMLGGYGVNPFAMNPYGMSPYGMMSAGNMFDSIGMLNNYTNPYLTQAGNQWAYQWGRNIAIQQSMNPAFSGTSNLYNTELTDEQIDKFAPERNNQRVVADPNADTKLGKAFEDGTDALNKDKDAEAVNLSEDKFSNDNKAGYVSNLGKVAESYIAKIGSNGTISEDDYINHEFEIFETDNPNIELTEETKTKLENNMKLAFAKLDLNRDGKIDKNEMTSALATFDTGGRGIGSSNAADGKITAAEYKSAQDALKARNTTFATNNWNNYQQLFGKQDNSEK